MENRHVAIIGLGAMGLGMARILRTAGYKVYANDVRAEAAREFAAGGGEACATPADAARDCKVILSVVVNAAQTEQVLFGPHGAAEGMQPGSVFVMCSTVAPEWSANMEKRLSERGLLYLDCPMSGGAVGAATGKLTFMASGRPQAFAAAEPVLAAMAGKIYKMGDQAGLGSKMKIINQLLAGVHLAAAAEAMALALREGVDPQTVFEVIANSAGNSWMFGNRMPHVLDADYTPRSAVDIFVKDLGLVLDTARASKFPLPLASAAHQLFLQASAMGFGREDDAAVIKVYPGITLPEPKQ